MTDEQFAAYEAAIEPVRVAHRAEQDAYEARAAAGVARDLDGLAGIHGEVIAWIESRWIAWLYVRTARLAEDYERAAQRIRTEIGIE
jgi:hypothetical protein